MKYNSLASAKVFGLNNYHYQTYGPKSSLQIITMLITDPENYFKWFEIRIPSNV